MNGLGQRTHRHDESHVTAAIAEVYNARPGPSAPTAQQAVWWHRNAAVLDLIAENEADGDRSTTARSDADAARRLARSLALTHAHQRTAARAEAADETARTADVVVAREDAEEEVFGL
jgi:hypothetical protein